MIRDILHEIWIEMNRYYSDVIKASFKNCGISNALDGSEEDQVKITVYAK